MAVTNSAERDALSEEQEDSSKDKDNLYLKAMVKSMGEDLRSVLKRLSRVETDKERPTKRLRVAEETESDSPHSDAEVELSDSEQLIVPQTEGGQNGEAPNSIPSVAEDDLLSEIAQEFADEATTGPKVSQKLADIINQHWSSKLEEPKLKGKMGKYDRPDNCEKLAVPKV